jgi:hypothetical protein
MVRDRKCLSSFFLHLNGHIYKNKRERKPGHSMKDKKKKERKRTASPALFLVHREDRNHHKEKENMKTGPL